MCRTEISFTWRSGSRTAGDTASSVCLPYLPRARCLQSGCFLPMLSAAATAMPANVTQDPSSISLYMPICCQLFPIVFQIEIQVLQGRFQGPHISICLLAGPDQHWAALQRSHPRDRDFGLPPVLKSQAGGFGPSCLSTRPATFFPGEKASH